MTRKSSEHKTKPRIDPIRTLDRALNRKLRLAVEPPGRRRGWMQNLGNVQLVTIYEHLKAGYSVYYIAKLIHEKWDGGYQFPIKTISKSLVGFRNKTLGLLKAYRQSFPATREKQEFVKRKEKLAERIVERVDALRELEKLILVQKRRIDRLEERERLGLPSKHLDKEIDAQRVLLDTFLTYSKELGLLHPKPEEYNINLKSQFDGMMGHVVRGDGNRMAEIADRFLENVSQHIIPMVRVKNEHLAIADQVKRLLDGDDGFNTDDLGEQDNRTSAKSRAGRWSRNDQAGPAPAV